MVQLASSADHSIPVPVAESVPHIAEFLVTYSAHNS